MIKIEHTTVTGWEAALRGMRAPLQSWDRSDTAWNTNTGLPIIGKNDMELARKLVKSGSEHRKFMRYIIVTFDITAPMMWMSQIDTYKVGTVRNSTSKMHKLLSKEFELSDFATEGMFDIAKGSLAAIVDTLNQWRRMYLETPKEETEKRKAIWEGVLRVLPESYCQTSTMQMNYEVLRNIYQQRVNHKLHEWHEFCKWIQSLPYSELITEVHV